jgi:hypothetical protein
MGEDLNIADLTTDEYQARMTDAIDAASDQNKITWLTGDSGRRIAAIVPVDVAEWHDRDNGSGQPELYCDVLRGLEHSTDECGLCGHVKLAHTSVLPAPREPRGTVDCAMCADGKCRTPAAAHKRDLEAAAQAGLLSSRRR